MSANDLEIARLELEVAQARVAVCKERSGADALELARYRKREPLVQKVVSAFEAVTRAGDVDAVLEGFSAVQKAAEELHRYDSTDDPEVTHEER